MQWINLSDLAQLNAIKNDENYNLIFKHSTRCSISLMVKKRFELDWDALPEGINLYFLDLISNRDISAAVAEVFQVHHESPQLLLIKNGECVLDASHGDISAEEVVEMVKG
ncbi:bacillithiol system redox-active protein YtxJ [Pedobacter sp. Du54]|uniref:bacillithiol system redox-active protein YtxJ n=1 Tax=Pedobacter anseongensis TaxID=3133439 RepID=UPI0030995A2C